ncbi:molybdopterin molybdotransferase MoeA [Planctomicrobium sp. SH668]|uniref:molybdopterin molybdotransferase MoeA n=1 Tax=Planctomicrobium sp. SH668 TaxID=3448126 RepID=UPI003F5C99D9
MISVEDAWEIITSHVVAGPLKQVPLAEAIGLVLGEEVVSSIDSPPFAKSMMDGFAVRSQDLRSSQVTLRLQGERFAGQAHDIVVEQGTAVRIMTGAPIPPGADAVIPVEWTEYNIAENLVEISMRKSVRLGMNIISQGEMMRCGDVLMGRGTEIRAQEIAILAEIGHAFPVVQKVPTVSILATGDELVEIEQVPAFGQIRNSNAAMLAAQVAQAGAIPHVLGIARDQRDDLRLKIQEGLRSDFLILSGGVSAGLADFVPSELQAAGVVERFHKIAMKPGKPLWFGTWNGAEEIESCFVFGLPGNPVSSMVCFELFVSFALNRFFGGRLSAPCLQEVILAHPVTHRSDRETWFPARSFCEEASLKVKLTGWKGSADLRSTIDGNCSLKIPAGEIDWNAGHRVQILQWGKR